MAKLVVKLDNKVVQELEIKGEISIGRDSGDVALKNPAVSAKHARISSDGNLYTIHDLNSTNGTFVNRGKIASHELRHGDVINIGKFEMEFIDPDSTRMTDSLLGGADAGMTVMINTENIMEAQKKKEEGKKTKKAVAARLILAQASAGTSGAIVTYKLEKETTMMGSGNNVDIHIKGLTVANVAATIRKSDDRYFIKFMGGLSKLKVNGKKISKEAELKSKDRVEIGSYAFQFLR